MNRLLGMLFALSIYATSAMAEPVDRAVAANYLPLMIEGNQENPGYAIEVLRLAAERAGRRVEVTFFPFQRAMDVVVTGPDVLMAALFFGKKPTENFNWIVQIQSAHLLFATTTQPVNSLERARTLGSIVVETGTTPDAMLTELGFENLIRVVTPASSALMLANGRADAWFQSRRTIEDAWTQLDLSDQLIQGQVLRVVPIYLVSSTTLPEEVAQAYREAVLSMQADGTLDRLWARYTGFK